MKKFIKLLCFGLILCAGGLLALNLNLFSIKVNSVSAAEISTPDDYIQAQPLPSKFNLADVIDINVENQGSLGICYAYASLTSIETYLALTYGEYYDFSEMHFVSSLTLVDNYYSSISNALSLGGNFGQFILYTQKDYNLVLEEEMPLQDFANLPYNLIEDTTRNAFNKINQNFKPLVKVNDTKTFPQYVGNKSQYTPSELTNFRNEVKNHLVNHGSLTAGIHSTGLSRSAKYFKVTDDYLVTNQSTINRNINHLISIVGWDDNYDADGEWENKGAYICLNSWGKSFGENGYFYVSYDDYFIETTIQGIKHASLSTTHNKINMISINQAGTRFYTHAFSESQPDVCLANIIDTSKYLNQQITHIDSFTQDSDTRFAIKFYPTKEAALANINNVYSALDSTKVGDYSLYSKYELSQPLTITDNYMVVVRAIDSLRRVYSLGNTTPGFTIDRTYYYQDNVLSKFDTNIWEPDVTQGALTCTIPLILHTNTQFVTSSAFESYKDSIINTKFTKNNSTFINKAITTEISNIEGLDINNITITSINNALNIVENFKISLEGNKLTFLLKSLAPYGEYIISIPCKNTIIYRAIDIQEVSINYSITYNLNGGQASNPTYYTSKHAYLALNAPTKTGYVFTGWYLDQALSVEFDENNLPYENLVLYAKYDIAPPSIKEKSSDVIKQYYVGINIEIGVKATHAFETPNTTYSYQWYIQKFNYSTFSSISGENNSTININNVADSGFYACEITIHFENGTTRTLKPSIENAIRVEITPYTYDMSKVVWDYSAPFSYNTNTHTVSLKNLPEGVTVSYSNNSHSSIGAYLACANLSYDDMGGNAYAAPVENLTWEIRRAKITISLQNIVSTYSLTEEEINSKLVCSIENEYLPENIHSLQDKMDYLEFEYLLKPTNNSNVKIISATTKYFDIYEIIINEAKYKVVVYALQSNGINVSSSEGFVKDCKFSANSAILESSAKQTLKRYSVKAINAIEVSYSYLDGEYSMSIPLEKREMLNNISVYMLKDGKLTKINFKRTSSGISFIANEKNATFIVARPNYSHYSNGEIITLIILSSFFITFILWAAATQKKHKY